MRKRRGCFGIHPREYQCSGSLRAPETRSSASQYDVIEHLARKLSSPVSLWCSNRSLSEVENLTLWRLGIVYPWLTDLKLSSYNNDINLFIKLKKKNKKYIYIYTHTDCLQSSHVPLDRVSFSRLH